MRCARRDARGLRNSLRACRTEHSGDGCHNHREVVPRCRATLASSGGRKMGVKLELSVLLAFAILGPAVFSPFELETPVWRKILKWTLMVALTLGLYRVVGHWALAVPVGMGIAGSAFHVIWCRRNGI